MENTYTSMEKLCKVMVENPDHLFDHISNHYQDFTKEELMNVIREMEYSMYTAEKRHDILGCDHRKILADTAESLADTYFIEFDSEE